MPDKRKMGSASKILDCSEKVTAPPSIEQGNAIQLRTPFILKISNWYILMILSTLKKKLMNSDENNQLNLKT